MIEGVRVQMDSGHLTEIHDRVVHSKPVRDAVESTPGSSLSSARRMVERMLGVQRAWMCWIVARVIRLVFPLLFPMGMHIDESSLAHLRSAVAETSKANGSRPVILLPTHKSHIDYLALALLFAETKLPIPLVVAGDNLNMPLFGSILHSGGAMFIRRSFAGDKVYSAVFNETMIELLENNHVMGCFIEGGRSRSGKLLTPKAGFLKSVVDAVLDGRVDDALIVPIAFSYGRVVEAQSMMQEMSGGTKKKEALGTSLKSMVNLIRTTFWGAACFGSIEISVAPAFSVAEHLKARVPLNSPTEDTVDLAGSFPSETRPSSPAMPAAVEASADGFDLDAVQQPGTAVYRLRSFDRKLSIVLDPETLQDKKTRVQLALSLGFRSLHECNRVGVIQGTTLVGTILLMHKDHRGLKVADLVDKVNWLTNEIVARGGTVQAMESVEATVAEVVDKIMWGSGRARLVKKHKQVVMTGLFTPMETLELSTFRNSLIHFFVQDAVVAVAMHAALMRTKQPELTKQNSNASTASVRVTNSFDFTHKSALLSDVCNSAQFLSVLLKHEFIYKPMQASQTMTPLLAPQGSAFADNFKSVTEFMINKKVIEVHEAETVNIAPSGKQMWEFLCGLLFPFIDAYYLTLLGCFVCLGEEVEMSVLISKIQDIGENLYMNNLMDHYDAVAKDTVANALTAFADIGIINIDSNATRQKIVRMKIPKSQVLQTIELLHSFRKGKGKLGDAPHQIADAIELGESLV